MKRRNLTISAADAQSRLPLPRLLARELPAPLEEAEALIRAGAVYVKGRRVQTTEQPLKEGDVVLVVLEERGQSVLAPIVSALPSLRVLLEDEHLLVVDKPPGIDAQPSPGRTGGSLLDLASAHLGHDAGLVHRLDRETSGVTVFGKTPEATSWLAGEFREGTARKRYLAACGPGLGESGAIDLPLSKDPSRPGRFRASRTANGVPAVTVWRRLYQAPTHCLVSLLPRTGRTHQLRAHLTALGAPILGDVRYGGARTLGERTLQRCLLHAHALVLRHPHTQQPLFLQAPVPEDLGVLFREAGITPPAEAP